MLDDDAIQIQTLQTFDVIQGVDVIFLKQRNFL